MLRILKNKNGFAKRWLIIIIILLIPLFLLIDYNAPSDKKIFFKAPLATIKNDNPTSNWSNSFGKNEA